MIGIIIQARLGSTRLPRKMTLPFYKEQGVLEIILRKVKAGIDSTPIVVATTINKIDDPIIEICNKVGVKYYRGSENNVLDRFIQSAKKYEFTKIIRICADNPFLDISALNELINQLGNKDVDYCSYRTSEGKPTILTHYGFWAEGVSLNALEKVLDTTNDPLYLEHVTNFIHSNPEKYKIKLIEIPKLIENATNLRLTLDTQEDYSLLKDIYAECIKRNITNSTEIVNFVNTNNNWLLRMKEQIKINTK